MAVCQYVWGGVVEHMLILGRCPPPNIYYNYFPELYYTFKEPSEQQINRFKWPFMEGKPTCRPNENVLTLM